MSSLQLELYPEDQFDFQMEEEDAYESFTGSSTSSGLKRKRSDDDADSELSSPRPTKKQKVVEMDELTLEEITVVKKKKGPNQKTVLKQAIIAAYNSDRPESEQVKNINKLTSYDVLNAYEKSAIGQLKGLSHDTFKKVYKDHLNTQVKKSDKEKKFVQLILPPLDTRDQYILASARLYVEKYCKDSETGNYHISVVSFRALPEEVKSDVFTILKAHGVRDHEALEQYMYTPLYIRNLWLQAEELRRNGVSSVTMNYLINQ